MFKTEYVDNFEEFYNEYKDHMAKHYSDFAATFGEERIFDPDVELFQQLINSGNANIFTLWDDEEFIGYVSVTITKSLLRKGYVDAVIDHFYIKEEARGKGYAPEVTSEIEKELQSSGISKITLALPASSSFDIFSKKLGYKKQSSVHTKILGENYGS